jgi:hypothetical protein
MATSSTATETGSNIDLSTSPSQALDAFRILETTPKVTNRKQLEITTRDYHSVINHPHSNPDRQRQLVDRYQARLAELQQLPIVEGIYQLDFPPSMEDILDLAHNFSFEIGFQRERGTNRWVATTNGKGDVVFGVESPLMIASRDQDITIHNHPGGFVLIPSDSDMGAVGELGGWGKSMSQVAELNLVVGREGVLAFRVSGVPGDRRLECVQKHAELWRKYGDYVQQKTGLDFETFYSGSDGSLVSTAELFQVFHEEIEELASMGMEMRFAPWGDGAEEMVNMAINPISLPIQTDS